jgi:hypothetical protein
MRSNLVNQPIAMAAVPIKKLVYVLGGAGAEAVTTDRSLNFQIARVWPYKAVTAATGAITANANAINVGSSGLPISVTLTSLILTAGEALAVKTAHGLFNGEFVTISGATPSGLNGTFVIYEVGTDTFKYRVAGVTDAVATGTITAAKGAATPYNILAAVTTPLVLTVPLGMKRAVADIIARGTATDGLYVEWE